MNKNYFEIKRAGINTTFQDQGRSNLYHIGIPFSGAMDNRNFQISNKLVGNETNSPVIEFAYQGPLLKYFGDNIKCAITGDVKFIIKKNRIKSKMYHFDNLFIKDNIITGHNYSKIKQSVNAAVKHLGKENDLLLDEDEFITFETKMSILIDLYKMSALVKQQLIMSDDKTVEEMPPISFSYLNCIAK